jgi:hypothetical protein
MVEAAAQLAALRALRLTERGTRWAGTATPPPAITFHPRDVS